MLYNKTMDSVKKMRKDNRVRWQGGDVNIITDDPSTKINELELSNKMWASQNMVAVGTTKREAPKMQEIIESRKINLETNWSNNVGLTPWQEYARKTYKTPSEPLMLLMYHDANVNYLISRSRHKANLITGGTVANPSKQQVVEALMGVYDSMKNESRDKLRDLYIRANRKVAGKILRKLVENVKINSQYLEQHETVPVPQSLSVNVNKAGSRSLSGGNPFVI